MSIATVALQEPKLRLRIATSFRYCEDILRKYTPVRVDGVWTLRVTSKK